MTASMIAAVIILLLLIALLLLILYGLVLKIDSLKKRLSFEERWRSERSQSEAWGWPPKWP